MCFTCDIRQWNNEKDTYIKLVTQGRVITNQLFQKKNDLFKVTTKMSLRQPELDFKGETGKRNTLLFLK